MGWFDTFKRNHKQEYSARILDISAKNADTIRDLAGNKDSKQDRQELNDTQWFNIFMEFIYFYLHVIFRNAIGYMDTERLDSLMKELEAMCIHTAVDFVRKTWPQDMKEKVKEECMQNYYAFMREYSAYKPFPGKEEGPKNTLFYEFAKTIARLAGMYPNLGAVLDCEQIAVYSLEALDMKSFIEKVK